jgi:hypothetical protein
MTLRLPWLAAALIASLLVAGSADARRKPPKPTNAAAAGVIQDCVQDGDLDRVYRDGVVKLALRRLPADVRNYTDCADVLRARLTAGRTVYVKARRARLRVRCIGNPYSALITRRDNVLASGAVPACKRSTRVVRLASNRAALVGARRHRLARVTLTPNGKSLSFKVQLRPFRR